MRGINFTNDSTFPDTLQFSELFFFSKIQCWFLFISTSFILCKIIHYVVGSLSIIGKLPISDTASSSFPLSTERLWDLKIICSVNSNIGKLNSSWSCCCLATHWNALLVAQSICTQYSWFENQGRFVTLKKIRHPAFWKKQGAKNQGHCYSKREEAAWSLFFLNNNDPVFLHPPFCKKQGPRFFKSSRP